MQPFRGGRSLSPETAGAQSEGRRGIGSEENLGTVARGGGVCVSMSMTLGCYYCTRFVSLQ
jgi:hypothetical protein